MARALSSVDTGASSSGAGDPPSSSTSTGGAGSSSYWADLYKYADGDFDPSDLFPSYNRTDKALALVRLGLGCCFIVLGTYALFRFYRSRWILDIRTRSAHLVTLQGVSLLFSMLVTVNGATTIVWDSGLDWFWISLLLFFVSPALFGSYICRALRLAVVFNPRAKSALPWLIPERNYLAVLLLASIGILAIPIYHEYTLEVWDAIPKQTSILKAQARVLAVTLVCIYPFIRNVDDLFNISTELITVTVTIVVVTTVQEVVDKWGGDFEQRWLTSNISVVFVAVLFCISIVAPLRRLALDPLAATKRNYADRVLLSRTESHSTRSASGISPERAGRSSRIVDDSDDEVAFEDEELGGVPGMDTTAAAGVGGGSTGKVATSSAVVGSGVITTSTADANVIAPRTWKGREMTIANGSTSVPKGSGSTGKRRDAVQRGQRGRGGDRGRGGGGGRGRSDREEMEVWDFERLGRTPLLAAAFEDYSKRALCHESVLFLSEVSRYQNDDYATPTNAAGTCPTQFGTFCYITDTFIKAGAPEEVNISDKDRKLILELYQKGEESFEEINEEERRMVFKRSYLEVKSMLEANLLRRFLNTDQFKSVRKQRENVQAMMDSPPLPAGVAAA
ncbi:unnamed protein product [Ectocarpus sp. 6 AP-2014]